MNQCSAHKANGERCTLPANGPHGLCWAHDPENAGKRRRNASRAARAKGNKEVAIIKEEIKAAISEVRSGDLDRQVARAMFTGWGVLLDYIRLERQVYLEDDLAARIEELKNNGQPDHAP